jgi:hypothetical protein
MPSDDEEAGRRIIMIENKEQQQVAGSVRSVCTSVIVIGRASAVRRSAQCRRTSRCGVRRERSRMYL